MTGTTDAGVIDEWFPLSGTTAVGRPTVNVQWRRPEGDYR